MKIIILGNFLTFWMHQTMHRFASIFRRLFKEIPSNVDHEIEAHNSADAEEQLLSRARSEQNLAPFQHRQPRQAPLHYEQNPQEDQEEEGGRRGGGGGGGGGGAEEEEEEQQQQQQHVQSIGLPQQSQWVDPGYVKPEQEVKCEGLAILDAKNYGDFKDLDVNMAKLHFEHELPSGYSIIRRIGRGAFGCCFLVQKQTELDLAVDPEQYQIVLKVVRGMIKPRRPVLFYKTCSLYTILISLKAVPLASY